MKILNVSALRAMLVCAGLSACVAPEGAPSEDDPPHHATTSQEVQDTCAALDGCIDTAQRDGNYWMIEKCIEVLGGGCPEAQE